MTYSKYAFVPIGFLIILLLNIVVAMAYIDRTQPYIEEMEAEGKTHSPLKSKRTKYIYATFATGGIYFFLLMLSGGFFLFEKNKIEDVPENQNANWWWQIYLGLWFTLLLIVLQLFLVPHLPYRVWMPLSDKGIAIFIFKGLVLIPAAMKNSNLVEEQKNHYISKILYFEILAAAFLLLFLNALKEIGSIYQDN